MLFFPYWLMAEPIKNCTKKLDLQKMNMDYKVFDHAMQGFNKINPPNQKYIVINDYSQSSSNKRFYLINLLDQTVELNDYVAHGKNTGGLEATDFSNVVNSKKSSLGFYLTGNSYYGSNGYSLRLKGLEEGINDNAMERAIVMHGASYVSDKFVTQYGRVGRSWGCPAISTTEINGVIGKIEGGTLMLSYSDSDSTDYLAQSDFNNPSMSIEESIEESIDSNNI